jgi:NarL family two-component system response regulator LiaR
VATEIRSLRASRTSLRLAIVNDYELVAAGLAAMLGEHGPRVRVVELTQRLPPTDDVDIVLMDTFASVSRGAVDVSTLSRQARSSGGRVVVYSWVTDPESVQRALAHGAAGYLWKGLDADGLLAALEAVRSGEVVTPSSHGRGEVDDAEPEPEGAQWPGHDSGLSAREAEVVALIAKGLSNEDIASELFLGINTVKTYIRLAYRKIGVTSRTQAVLWALDHGFALQVKRTVPPAGGAGLDAGGYLRSMTRAPAQPTAPARVQTPAETDEDVALQLRRSTARAQAVVPRCVGLSLASALGDYPLTLAATSDDIAVLDAAQYLSGGPCVDAAQAATALLCTEEQLADMPGWRRFAAATAAAGVASTLSLPITDTRGLVGTVNLYASTRDAFEGHDEALARVFEGWAATAIGRGHVAAAALEHGPGCTTTSTSRSPPTWSPTRRASTSSRPASAWTTPPDERASPSPGSLRRCATADVSDRRRHAAAPGSPPALRSPPQVRASQRACVVAAGLLAAALSGCASTP